LLFEDDHTLVLEKPAGLPTHRSSMSTDSLQEMAQAFVKARGESYRVSPVNRLDIGTSGPVMFGKGARSTGRLGELFMSGEVDKIYLALVCGAPPAQGVLHSPVPAHGKLKQAVTRYRRLSHVEGFTLLQLHLDTGRLHQLRRQLSAAGWPILGDIRYHGRAWPGLNHCFLHCCTLGFNRLENGSPVQIDCLLPAALCIILDQLGLAAPSTSGKGPNQA
jgi:23S rRNA pseudouridine955/2504/2580 synthase